jgi:ArsR family transcriptional regulator, arsenate/arsenite/antimonite-responsive transcriptional repressor
MHRRRPTVKRRSNGSSRTNAFASAPVAAGGEAVCVCEFETLLALKQPTVSYHLKQLLNAGIVEREKRGAFAYYSLVDDALERDAP